MYGLTIVFILLIIVMLGKLIMKSWFNPASLLTIYWATFIIFALIAFDNFEWNYIGVFWIIITCIFFGGGYILGSSFVQKRLPDCQPVIKRNEKITGISWRIIWVIIIIGLSRTILEVVGNGFSLKMLFNIDSLININTDMAYQRYYEGGPKNNILMQIMLVFVYAGPLCGGYAFNHAEKKSQLYLSFLTFVPSISSLLVTNGKAGLMASVFLWCSGFIVGYIGKYKKAPTIKLKRVIRIGVIGLLFIGLLYLSMLLRIGDFSKETRDVVSEKFEVYALGHIPAFDYWFMNYENDSSYIIGEYTFSALFDTLGLTSQQQGIFKELVYITDQWPTNIYTVFRGLISDFGIFGGWLFSTILGLLAGILYNLLLLSRNSKSILVRVSLSMIYFSILYSFIVSSFSYLSFILAFFVFAFYLRLSDQKQSKEKVSSI
ncbi:O-antigen polymerase [Cytobacillus oceanisediminis]|uniref:O-antigen polymerase n=1 Tax=Cytobacillus oceanisediminis TaxID=665099 RepID=UPI0024959D22|nr:O-antigen polymerase [Cytobacillus oceanisediminis]